MFTVKYGSLIVMEKLTYAEALPLYGLRQNIYTDPQDVYKIQGREISNSCARNQMRDVFFSEIETEDPEAYVRREIKGSDLRLEIQPLAEGAVCIYVESAGMFQKFLFTPLDD